MKEKNQNKNKKRIVLTVIAAIVLFFIAFMAGHIWSYNTFATDSQGNLWMDAYNESEKKYDEYVEDMKPYVEKVKAIEKEDAAAKAKEAAAEAEKQAKKEKVGYDTGITYDQLARTPDKYEGEKIKFKGEVLQVIEEDEAVTIRLAVNGNYDDVIIGGYDSSLVDSRVLEGDTITIYGESGGLYSYDAVLGNPVTIPLIYIDKISQ